MQATMWQMFAIAAAMVMPGRAGAAEPAGAIDALKVTHAELQTLVRAGEAGPLEQRLRGLFDEEAIAADVLGPAWAARSERERSEFRPLAAQTLRRKVTRLLQALRDADLRFRSEMTVGELVIVRVQARRPDAAPLELAFKLTRGEGAWKIRDVIVDDVSAVAGMRARYARVLEERGFSPLVEQLRRQLAADPS